MSDDLPNVSSVVQQLHHRMLAYKDTNDLDAAINTSLEIVDTLADEPGESLIRPLLNLGLLQVADRQTELGISNLRKCVELIEETEGVFSPRLVKPLYSMGASLRSTGDHNEAVDTLRRVQHIIHRHDGVYSADQLDVLDQLTILSMAEGDLIGAGRQQYFYLKVNEAEYGAHSLEIIPALGKYAQYLKAVGRFQGAIAYYDRAISIIENSFGAMDIRLIEPLQGIADVRLYQQEAARYGIVMPGIDETRKMATTFNPEQTNPQSYLLQSPERLRTSDGKKALERALDIINNHPQSDITDRIDAIVRLGDLYTITGDPRASDLYQQAFEIMRGRDDLEELNNDLFGFPTRIQPKNAHVLPLYTSGNADQYFADVEFMVRPSGRPSEIRVVDANVPNQERRMLKGMIFKYRYRPKMVDGELVTATIGIHQVYYPIAIPSSARSNGADSADTKINTSDTDQAADTEGVAN
jgi:tetratricopeptide (TPR) repeat protein